MLREARVERNCLEKLSSVMVVAPFCGSLGLRVRGLWDAKYTSINGGVEGRELPDFYALDHNISLEQHLPQAWRTSSPSSLISQTLQRPIGVVQKKKFVREWSYARLRCACDKRIRRL